jgi:hypothetical protein
VAGSLEWSKVKSTTGDPLAGATFRACRTSDWSSATQTFVARPTPDCITGIVDDGSLDESKVAGSFKISGLKLGNWVVTETAAPANWVLDATPKSTPSDQLSTSKPNYSFPVAFKNIPAYQGETATGGGYPWSATSGGTGNWFMYSPWNPAAKFDKLALVPGPFTIALDPGLAGTSLNGVNVSTTVPLIAGQQYTVGTVTGSVTGAQRYITVTLTNYHQFSSVSNNVKIQPLTSCLAKDLSYVQPGQFSIKQPATNSAGGTSFIKVAVPSTDKGKNVVCYAVHVDVQRALAF